MNFKVLTIATLLLSTVCFSAFTVAEKMPETAQQKEDRIEGNLTFLFREAINASAAELDKDHQMAPFAMLMKKDGKLGFFSTGDKNKGLSIDQQVASIRALLIDMASTQQIDASVQVMYAGVANKSGESSQGLVFEIEHREGVSIMRFIPVSEIKDDKGVKTGKLMFEMEKLSTGSKPQTVFAASIVQ
jgi:hypothetical protein